MNAFTLGVLLCDHVAVEREPISGDYPRMFAQMFCDHPQVQLRFYDLTAGEYPLRLGECDGYLTSGSAASVNDDDPWITAFEAFVRRLHDAQAKLFAICFGHQMIAKALGGRVEVSDQGWGVGVHKVSIDHQEPWMVPAAESYQVIGSHQEQITELPPGAVILASTPHCPVSAICCGSLVGIQGHPEFGAAYAKALLDSRESIIPAETRAAASSSFATPPDRALLTEWIVSYMRPR